MIGADGRRLADTSKTAITYKLARPATLYLGNGSEWLGEEERLSLIGWRVYEARSKIMVAGNFGLTELYNRLKDPKNQDPEIIELRHLHEDMDREVLASYGWPDIAVPPFEVSRESAEQQMFDDVVIPRLMALNAVRAAEEAGVAAASVSFAKLIDVEKAVRKIKRLPKTIVKTLAALDHSRKEAREKRALVAARLAEMAALLPEQLKENAVAAGE